MNYIDLRGPSTTLKGFFPSLSSYNTWATLKVPKDLVLSKVPRTARNFNKVNQ
jgi:hypothetical protein